MTSGTNRNADYLQVCSACYTFFTNADQIDYSCAKCVKIYCRECLKTMIVQECVFITFGYTRRYFCSEVCERAKRQHKCINQCRVFTMTHVEKEYPLVNN